MINATAPGQPRPTHPPFLDAAPAGCGRAIAEAAACEQAQAVEGLVALRADGLSSLACTLPVGCREDVAVLVMIITAELRDADMPQAAHWRIKSALTAILDYAAPSAADRAALGGAYFGLADGPAGG